MKKSVLLLTLATLIVTTVSFAQETYKILKDSTFNETVFSSGVLKEYRTMALSPDELQRLYRNSSNTINLLLPGINNTIFECELQKKNVFADRAVVNTSSGEAFYAEDGLHYRGKLKNDDKSLVAFSFFTDCIYGIIANDYGNYNIVFLRDEKQNPTNRYVIYNDRDLTIQNDFSCLSEQLPEFQNEVSSTINDSFIYKSTVDCRTVKQYLECDYKMFQDNGSNLQNTVNFTTAMFNVMAGIYENEQVDIKISEIYVWNTNDNYPSTNANTILKAFGNKRQDNFNGHIAHLLSTKSGSNGGLAWVKVLCKSYVSSIDYGRFAYSNIQNSFQNLPLFSWTIDVVTHETGHNLGSQHTHWCGWELSPGNFGPIDKCYATEAYNGVQCYSGPSQAITGTIMSYCHINGNINLNAGFGPLPGNAIRAGVKQAACLGPSAPTVTGTLKYCAGENIKLTASAVGGQLQWQGPNNFTSNANSISIPNSGGSHAGEYSAKIVGSMCTASRTVKVDVSSKPEQPIIVGEQGGSLLHCQNYVAAYDYEWYSQGNELLNTTASFSPPSAGMYYVKASNNGCKSEASELFMTYNLMSMNENNFSGNNVWPNPTSGPVNIQMSDSFSSKYRILVFDMNGRLILERNEQSLSATLDLSSYTNGLYNVQVISDNGIINSKIILERN